MQTPVAHREIRRLSEDRLSLPVSTIDGNYLRSYRGPIRLYSDQQHLEPMMLTAYIVSQQRRRFVHIHHDDIDVAVIVEVSECRPPAGMQFLHRRPGKV